MYVCSPNESSVRPDVIIDFSRHDAIGIVCDYARGHRVPLVVATTGHTREEQERIRQCAAVVPVYWAANVAYGMLHFANACASLAASMPEADIEIKEIHRQDKLDRPSGTALYLADRMRKARACSTMGKQSRNEISIRSVREGDVKGTHIVRYGLQGECITLTHRALSRDIFAKGALSAAKWIIDQPAGLYGLEHRSDI